MSFFGFAQPNSLEDEKRKFLETGAKEGDVPVYTWGEDSYDGLGDALQEGGDELNDETFGGSGPVGTLAAFSSAAGSSDTVALQERTLTSGVMRYHPKACMSSTSSLDRDTHRLRNTSSTSSTEATQRVHPVRHSQISLMSALLPPLLSSSGGHPRVALGQPLAFLSPPQVQWRWWCARIAIRAVQRRCGRAPYACAAPEQILALRTRGRRRRASRRAPATNDP